MAKRQVLSPLDIIKALFKKYQRDRGNIIVSSISFYVLLTFIPLTLFSLCILGYVIDLKNPAAHFESFIRSTLPAPYDAIVVHKVFLELNIISVTKKLSGPLGLAFLLFFTSRLFAVIRPSFHIIFGKKAKGFFMGKGEELLLTLLFSVLQTFLFFSFIASVILQAKFVKALGGVITKTPIVYLFSFLDMMVAFVFLYLLYYFLTPVRDKKLLLISTIPCAFFWYLGKYGFKYFILSLGRYTTFFGAYGAFIAFLLWVYFSVFVFVICAEMLSVLSHSNSQGHRASYLPFRKAGK
jgi:membrane protein